MADRDPCDCGRIHGSVVGKGMPPGRPPAGGRPDDPVRVVAEALWNIGQGYTAEDVAAVAKDSRVDWCLLNADDVADEAMHMGHAAQVLEHLTAAGWGDVKAARADLSACLRILDQLLASARWEPVTVRPVPWADRTVDAAQGIAEASELTAWTQTVREINDRNPGALDG